jgi:hypothetical protein
MVVDYVFIVFVTGTYTISKYVLNQSYRSYNDIHNLCEVQWNFYKSNFKGNKKIFEL